TTPMLRTVLASTSAYRGGRNLPHAYRSTVVAGLVALGLVAGAVPSVVQARADGQAPPQGGPSIFSCAGLPGPGNGPPPPPQGGGTPPSPPPGGAPPPPPDLGPLASRLAQNLSIGVDQALQSLQQALPPPPGGGPPRPGTAPPPGSGPPPGRPPGAGADGLNRLAQSLSVTADRVCDALRPQPPRRGRGPRRGAGAGAGAAPGGGARAAAGRGGVAHSSPTPRPGVRHAGRAPAPPIFAEGEGAHSMVGTILLRAVLAVPLALG